MTLRPIRAAVLLLLSTLTFAAQADDTRRSYIVQLSDKPVASYAGDISGLNATQPAPGQRLDLDSADVQLYTDYLGQKQATVQAAIAGAPILYTYSVVLNGFAALLTDDEVRQLQARSDVAAITLDTPRKMDTISTPAFLGLDKPGGLWEKLGGKGSAGENIIVGIVDGGIWPESPAVADRLDANGKPSFDNSASLVYGAAPAQWKGVCQTGEGFTAANCNNKLIGARYFDATYRTTTNVTHWSEFRSPRDSIGSGLGEGGHGTHTATTAAGNNNVDVTISGLPLGQASGMAPRARVAAYKVCWSYNDASAATGAKNSCYTGDSVMAIEQAVVDGVNVINYSISGGTTIGDPVEQAFLHASNAGVFVAASAGNSGPDNTVAHISPWQATVAASTHGREFQADVKLGNGASYTGASMSPAPVGPAPLVRAEDAAVAGADPTRVTLCYSAGGNGGVAVLDPAKISGKIVICTRGVNARTDKSLAVAQGGGVGMVMVDTGGGLVAEPHSVPTVHVSAANGAAIQAYAATLNASASITRFVVTTNTLGAPVMAGFSSRGPNVYDANQLKPDLTAPGVDVIAGVTPALTQAERANVVNGTLVPPPAWASYQGTSMASPHVAGLAALLKQQHPTWTPAAIKSALMTTATDTLPDAIASGDTRGILPFAQGAGHVNPNGASDPGLVYDATQVDYKKYMCGTGMTAECGGGTITGYNLNLPSIAVGNVLGSVVVNRSVTNVGASSATYTSSSALTGFSVAVNPASFTLAPGATRAFTVTLTRTTAPDNVWQFGKLTWTDGSHVVRSPIVARSGKPLIAPSLFTSDRAGATKLMSVATGFTGKMNTVYGGLKEISREAFTVQQATSGTVDTVAQIQTACKAAGSGVRVVPVTVPAGSVLAQFELFDRDTASHGGDDLDLALLNGAGTVVATSLHGGSNESIILPSPAAGDYRVCVIGYEAANGVSTDFTLSSAVVTATDRGGNFKVMVPTKVYAGSTASVGISWSGLAAGKRFAGAAQLLDLSNTPAATTVFKVDTSAPLPLGEAVERALPKDSGM
ncbi:MAG: S8 family serine peptidase [Massilia sp.]